MSMNTFTIQKQIRRLKVNKITLLQAIKAYEALNYNWERDEERHYCETYDVDSLPKSDVYYLTRVQKERGSTGSYQLTKEHVKEMPNNCIVMHPFPRNEEIPKWFDDDPRAKYFDQMKNGLYVRMSLLLTYK